MTKSDRVITTLLIIINLLLFLQLAQFANAQSNGPAPPSPTSLSDNTKLFNPSFAVIMVILIGAFFLLGFFSVYVRQCVAGAGGFSPADAHGDGRRPWMEPRGLDAAVIETFPTFAYSYVKGLKIGKDSLECAVCLNEFEDDETLRLIPKCNHVFHPECVDTWLSSNTTCPVCRADLEPKPGEILPILVLDPESEADEPQARPGSNETTAEVSDSNCSTRPSSKVQSPDVSFQIPNKSPPPRTRSTGFRVAEIFSRSHTTGHSLVQVGENWDRFTLRLPEEVRSQLLNSSLNRAKSCVAFPRARSTKKDFPSGSNRSGRRGLSMTPPFFSRTGSVRSPNNMVVGGTGEEGIIGAQKSLFKSVKSPFDRLFLGADRENNNVNNNIVGERSFDRLKLDSQV